MYRCKAAYQRVKIWRKKLQEQAPKLVPPEAGARRLGIVQKVLEAAKVIVESVLFVFRFDNRVRGVFCGIFDHV